ncbi:MAG: hypothetical protein H0X29_00460 [Parachlamydiaceae bacterium]|nr:hypothetical protein [Parachlamydiaceae bacterium]
MKLNLRQNDRLSQVIKPFIKKLGLSNLNPDNLIYIPLKGGGSQATLYRFNIAQRAYVVRLLPPQANQLTRMHQINLAKQAGEIGLGPKVYFVEFHLEGMVTNFIPGRTVCKTDFDNDDNLAKFAKLLQKLHKSIEKFPVACSPFQRFQNFFSECKKRKNNLTFTLY